MNCKSPTLLEQTARILVRLLPRGRNPLIHRLVTSGIISGTRCFRTAIGPKIVASVGDQVGRDIFFHGVYEPVTTAVVQHLLRRGDTFVDVGASIGFFTLVAADAVGPQGKVYAFEPYDVTRSMLLASLQINGYKNVVVDARACADKSGKFRVVEGRAVNLGESKVQEITGEVSSCDVIEGVRLDDFFAEQNIRLLKMDIEGAEDAALAGLSDALERRICENMIIEFHPVYDPVRGEQRVQELTQQITSHGYSVRQFRETPPGLLSRYRCRYSDELFLSAGEQPASVREKGTPQFLFQRQ